MVYSTFSFHGKFTNDIAITLRQKQSTDMFLKTNAYENFGNLKGKHLCRVFFLVVSLWEACNFIEMRLRQKTLIEHVRRNVSDDDIELREI